MLRKIRILLAALCFMAITLLFLDITGVLHSWLGWLAKVQFVPAVLALNFLVVAALVVLTLVFGRIYCSVICPLGVMQDLIARLGKWEKKNRYTYSAEKKWLRYVMLAVFIVAIVIGGGVLMQLLEPYSAYGRIATTILQPFWQTANNLLAVIAERLDSYAFYSADVWMKSLPVFGIALVTLAVLAVMAWRNGRTYCNTICPVGTILGFLARFSLMKVRFVDDKCRNCSLCTKNCKASCIDFKNRKVDYSRCVVCGNCLQSCKFGALRYAMPSGKKAKNAGDKGGVDAGKRSFLIASAMATTAAMAQDKLSVDGGLAPLTAKPKANRSQMPTPPGSLSAQNMAQRCTGCQLCVSECPNGVLRPSTDLMHLMQPVMSFERGFCRPECTRCSEVCPTGAIKLIDKVEKTSIQIGHAVLNPKYCLPLLEKDEDTKRGGDACGNCARHCPTGAIMMVPSNPNDELSPEIPTINESICIGCGACENVCPSHLYPGNGPAIYVEGHEVHHNI